MVKLKKRKADLKEVLDQVCKKYNLIVRQLSQEDESVNNHSYIADNEIILGDYEDDELKLISFFHELGHHLIPFSLKKELDFNTLLIELECWRLGVLEAHKFGVLFSDKAIEWGYNQAFSYVGHDERECVNWEQNCGAKLWRNKVREY